MKRLLAALCLAVACGTPVADTALDATAGKQYAPPEPRYEDPAWYAPPTTALRRVPPTTRASRGAVQSPRAAAPAPSSADVRRVSSTAYCLRGRMASGRPTYSGAAAMNGVPLGSRWHVVELGRTFVIEDRIGHGSQFDIWFASCEAAIQYGRRTVTIRRVG
jgi:3D (Asp-Asp-Asp) domain-containing protein